MKITMNESEIENAVRAYLAETISVGIAEIDFIATRGASGITAEITVDTGSGSCEEVEEEPAAEEVEAAPAKKAKPKVAKKAAKTNPSKDNPLGEEPVPDNVAEAAKLLEDGPSEKQEASAPESDKSLFS